MPKEKPSILKKRKSLNLNEKLQIIEDVEDNKLSYSTVARKFKINESSIRWIVKQKSKILKLASVASKLGTKVHRVRDPEILDMENALNTWIETNTNRGYPVDSNTIKEKALEFYSVYKTKHGVEEADAKVFNASKGWFHKFCKRYGLRNIRIHGEMGSADLESASQFPAVVEEAIKAGGYCLEQVFNCDETKLFYKKAPQRSYVSEQLKTMPGTKGDKKGFSILFCSNATGSLMMKPLVINNVAKPRAIRKLQPSNLPVHYRSNKKGWMTREIFEEWVNDCFAPELEEFCASRNIGFKALLLMDNAPSHPPDLNHPNIKFMFMPPNTTSVIQPLNQGIIRNFKLHYVHHSYKQILESAEKENLSLTDSWKRFDLKNCFDCVHLAVLDIKPTTLKNCWKKLLPSYFTDPDAQPENSDGDGVFAEIVEIGKMMGVEDFSQDDLKEIIDGQPATVEEVVASLEPDTADIGDISIPPPSAEEIESKITQLNELESFCALDSNSERREQVQDLLMQFHPQLKVLLKDWKNEQSN